MKSIIRLVIIVTLLSILPVFILSSTAQADQDNEVPLPPSVVLIEQAYREGKIDYDTTVQYKVFSIFNPQALPVEYQSTTPAKCATPILIEVNRNWQILRPETRNKLSGYPVGRLGLPLFRPTLSGPEFTYSTTHFQIHYTTSGADAVDTTDVSPSNGIPDYIENMGSELENVWTAELSNMGWLQPPSDVSEDGDSDCDIYVEDMPYYGYAMPEDYADQGTATGDNENSASVTEVNAVYGYLALENDYSGFPNTPLDNIRVTAAHEFNHAIQFGYDYWEETWLMEATATWIEDEVYDGINDSLQYLTYYLNNPDVAMPSETPGLHWYGDWIFPRYISEHHGGQSTVRSIWENSVNYDSYYGYYSFNTVQDALSSAGTSLAAVFNNFTVANYVMSTSPTNDPYCYEEASSYPSVYIEGNINFPGSIVNYTPSDGVGNYSADYITISSTTDQIQITVSGASSSITYAARVIGMQSGVPTVTDIPLSGSPDSGSITISTSSYDTVILIVLNETPESSSLTMSDYSVQVADTTNPPTMEPIAEAEGQYYNTAPSFSNFGFDDDVALDDGWYQIDSFTGTWTALFTDVAGTSWDNDGWTIPGFDALAEGNHTIYFKASDDDANVEGESGEWSWQFFKDTVPPTDPTVVTSTSHTISVWSTDNTVDITWTDATDATSGLDGYSILWDTNSNTIPDQTKDIEEGVEATTSSALADGNSHYFHIRTVDNAGNWQSTVHLGPFFTDATAPADPTGVTSTSHTVDVWSTDKTIDITWTDATDATSGLDGYSILWDTNSNTIPDQTKDIEEGVQAATSSALADGNSHYFHIRSVDNAGNWQSTVHLGPFFIDTANLPTMEPIAEAEGQYYNTAPSFSNFGFDDNVALDDGWYQIDSFAGSWTALFTDAPDTSWDSDGWAIPGFNTLAEGTHTIYFKASDDAGNVEGESGEWSWQFYKDTASPVVTIDAATTPTNVATQTLTGTMEEGATVTLSANTTATFGTVSYPTTTTWTTDVTLVEGSNLITATGIDTAGNTGIATATIVLDTLTTVTMDAVTTPTNVATQTLTGTMEEGATVVLTADTAATFGTVSYPTTTTWTTDVSLVEGSNVITATATDAAENTDTATATIVFDTSTAVTMDSVTTPTNVATQTVTGTMEQGATIVLTADTTATFGTVSYPTTTTWSCDVTLVEGSNVITATGTDTAGNTDAATTTIVLDTLAPSVLSTSPEADATDVAIDTVVRATINEAIDEATLVFTLDGVSGTVSYDSGAKTATFTPDTSLDYGTTYVASIEASDPAGNALAESNTWSFTTKEQDLTPPTVTSTSPAAGAPGVAVGTTVSVTFSEAMDASTITTSSFTLSGSTVSGTIGYDSATYTVTFTPSANLSLDTTYTATLSTAITDAAGNPLDAAYSWSFTTIMGSLGDEIDAIPPSGTLTLGAGTYSGDVTIDKPITITGTEGTIISGGIHVAPLTGSNVTIESVTITDYTAYGIWIELVGVDDVFTIRNNTIEGVEGSVVGIQVDEVEAGGSLTIEKNSILSNETGIKLLAAVADVTISYNDIAGNTSAGLELAQGANAGAEKNWWGDISGPKQTTTNPRGEGNEVSGNANCEPWLTRQFATAQADNIAYFGYAWVNLSVGWNIMSTPIALDPDADTWGEYLALGNPDLHIHATNPAFYFDISTQAWVALTSDYQLKACDAIYVRMAEADIAPILYSPNISVSFKSLYTGWNLVGLAALEDMSVTDALTSIYKVAGDLIGYSQVVSPSIGNQTAWVHIRDATTEPAMERTKGYWVFMLNAPSGTILTGFTFTPVALPAE